MYALYTISEDQLSLFMIERRMQEELAVLLKTFPAVALLGPRQVGKTTLTRELLKNSLQVLEL